MDSNIILNEFNNLNRNLKFTIENQEANKLKFLDITIEIAITPFQRDGIEKHRILWTLRTGILQAQKFIKLI